MKRKYKSIITRRLIKHATHLVLVVFLLFFGLSLGKIGGTNAFFMDDAVISGNNFSAGYWIPELAMAVDPENPDGQNDFYKTKPCVSFLATITDPADTEIHYSFTEAGGGVISGIYADACIELGDGVWNLEAYALFDDNPDWKSNVITEEFKVDTSAVEAGDVVINEIMWMGSALDNGDEWIELRNMTSHDIDLSNWDIMNAGSGSGTGAHLEIPHGYSIKADGYFLIMRRSASNSKVKIDGTLDNDEGIDNKSGMNLNDNGEELVLRTKDRTVIDTAWKNDHWPEGWHGIVFHMSMERKNVPGDGKDASSWYTCVDISANSSPYWKTDIVNFGTPGYKNKSKNDSTAEDYEKNYLAPINDTPETLEGDLTDQPAGTGTDADPTDADLITTETVDTSLDITDTGTDSDSGTPPAGETGTETPDSEEADSPPAETDSADEPKVIDEVVVPDPKPAETEVDKDTSEEKAKPTEPVKEPEPAKDPEPPADI